MLFRPWLWQWLKGIGRVHRNGLFLAFTLLDFTVCHLHGVFGFI
jgi:hypothetical protein